MTSDAFGPAGPPEPSARYAEAVARLFRQRSEMGGSELFLDGLSRDDVLSLLARARSGLGEAAPVDAAAPQGPPQSAGAAGNRADGRSASTAGSLVGAGSTEEESIRALDYDALKTAAMECHRCALSGERKQVVFSDGSPDARLMVVGEAPGAREDETGLPFVGPAGKLLDLLLASIDLSREESVYICNVIKCRPPANRNPLPGEIEACSPYLRRQIELVAPRAILAVGTFAGQLLTGRSSTLGNLRGDVYSYEGVPLVVTYHPAALLRNGGWVRSTWDDLQLLRQVLER